MKFAAAAAVVATALLLGAAAPKPPTSPWARKPTRERLLAVLPPESARPQGGFAAMRCKVGADGGMVDCQVIQEYPVGSGFGRVLRSLAPDYQMKPPAEGGVAPGGEVVIPGDWLPFDKASDWKRRPSPEDMVVVWPKKAWARGAGGRAVIHCLVSVQGALFDCFVASESPAGEHFGEAGIALTPQFLMQPATLRGQPVVSTVHIPLNFQMPGGMTTPPSSFGSKQSVLPVMAWPEAPSYAAVAAAYPQKARATKIGGRATLDCQFTKEGRLTACRTVAEEPRGQGFGDAAKTLAKQFRAFATTSDGSPVSRAAIQLPVIFDPVMLTDATPVIGRARWAGLPSAEDTIAAFSKVEAGHGTVQVMLACVVQQGGGVADCTVQREQPAGIGVGQAALALASHFRLTTWTAEGLPTVGGTVKIPLRYEGGDAAAAPAKP